MASVWFEGIDDLNKLSVDLTNGAQRTGAKVSAVVRRCGQQMVTYGQAAVPVDTGATKSSIGVDFTGDGRSTEMSATAGPTTSWAPYLEHGTERMAPHAFMGPALDRVGPDFVAGLEQAADPLDT